MYSGYVCLAYFWAQAVAEGADPGFYEAKIATARFYYQHILPRTQTSIGVIHARANSLMTLDADRFQF